MKKFRLIAAVCMLPMLLLSLAGSLPASASPAAKAGPQTWTVLVGGQSMMVPGPEHPVSAWMYARFYPQNITVHEGDTIVWKLKSMEFHEVIFPAPGETYVPFTMPDPSNPQGVMINPLAAYPQGGAQYDGSALTGSGLLGTPPTNTMEYSLTFTKAGSFNYLCSTHSAQLPNGQVVGMTGSVTVVGANDALPKTQAEIDADAQATLDADNQAAAAAEPTAQKVAPPTTNADGTMTYHGNVGWDTGDYSYMRFSPSEFTVHVGDSIQWTQTADLTPHTITFFSGQKEPDLLVAEPQAGGPPKLVLNPAAVAPMGGSTYDGTGVSSSGFTPGKNDPAPGPRSYSLTFTKPGTYEFICVLHDQMGMSGHVTVLPAGSGTGNPTPGMPQTGQSTDSLLPVVGVVALGMLLLMSGLFLVKRDIRI